MIDIFALVVSHGLLAIAIGRLLLRADLDRDAPSLASPEAAVDKTAADSRRRPAEMRWEPREDD